MFLYVSSFPLLWFSAFFSWGGGWELPCACAPVCGVVAEGVALRRPLHGGVPFLLCGERERTLRQVLAYSPQSTVRSSGVPGGLLRPVFPFFPLRAGAIALLNETSTQRYVTRRGLKSVFLFVSLRQENELLISIIYRIYEEMFLIGMRSVCLWLG